MVVNSDLTDSFGCLINVVVKHLKSLYSSWVLHLRLLA